MGWRLDESTLDVLVEYERLEAAMRRGEVRGGLSGLADVAMVYATLLKLGFDSTDSSIDSLLEESIDPLVEFHVGDWWNEENVSKFCQVNGLTGVDREEEIAFCSQFDPSKRSALTLDRRTLCGSILACLITNRDDALKTICATYHAEMPIDYLGESVDELFQRLLLLIAAHLAEADPTPFERVIESIPGRKLKMSIALQELVESVFTDDQSKFEETLASSLSIRMRRWEYMDVLDHISLEHSILIETARRRGLTIPTLSRKRGECVLLQSDFDGWRSG